MPLPVADVQRISGLDELTEVSWVVGNFSRRSKLWNQHLRREEGPC